MKSLWVDFQNLGYDGVRLICKGTLDELAKKNLMLYDGLELLIWSDDQNDEGDVDNLIVEAVVRYSETDGCWVATFDMNKVINESQRRDKPTISK